MKLAGASVRILKISIKFDSLNSTTAGFTKLKMKETEFDLVVIGSGPAGQKGAITVAKLGKRWPSWIVKK